MKITTSFLILIFFFTTAAISQDSIVEEQNEVNSLFMDLPVEENYLDIIAAAVANEKFRIDTKESTTRSILENQHNTKLVFEEYPLYPEGKCIDCYILSGSNERERILSLVLNFKGFNQKRYNELLKIILAKITPQVKIIEQNIGDFGAWETLFLFDEKAYTPRIRINEPAKAFTRIRIDYISEVERGDKG